MRTLGLICAAALTAALASSAPAAPTGTELDHILLWGKQIGDTSDVLAVKLGFQIRPGRNPGGIANRFVRFGDGSYIEVLAARPGAEMDPGMQADQARLQGEAGARSFGLKSSQLDSLHGSLSSNGFGITPIFEASLTDPDGQGPGKPPRWRLFAMEHPILSSTLFFIDYAPRTDPVSVADAQAATRHPNGTRKLSQIWLLSADPEADRALLAKMGYGDSKPAHLDQVHAKGYCVPIGAGAVMLLAPDGPGAAADALRQGGAQLFGVSLEVDDLERTHRLVERGYEKPMETHSGAFIAPTQQDLGLLIEFHAPRPAC